MGKLRTDTQPVHTPVTSLRLPWVDMIKGLAILGVVVYHVTIPLFGPPSFDHPKDCWSPLGERLTQLRWVPHEVLGIQLLYSLFRNVGWLGYQGVHLFLVVSGFGLTWSQLCRAPDTNIALCRFYKRRLWRILSFYWIGHFLFLLLHILFARQPWFPEVSLRDGRFYLSMAGVRFLPETFFYISPAWWYVGLILQLYIVYPALWAWLRRTGPLRFWLGTAAITLIGRFVLLIVVCRNREMWSMGAVFITRLFEFALGMGLAYWLAHCPDAFERLLGSRRALGIAVLAYLLALTLSFTVAGSIVAHSLIAVSLFEMAYMLSRYVLARVRRLQQALGWLGRQSYALMILHQPILWWFISWIDPQVPRLVLFLLLLPLLAFILMASVAVQTATEYVRGWTVRRASVLWALAVRRRVVYSTRGRIKAWRDRDITTR